VPSLFDSLALRDLTLRNRVGVSPMCQYSSENGLANDWHLVHLGSRAVGGAGLVMVEATAVEARGRISPQDMGIWSDAHVEPLARVARFVAEQGATAGIQLAHAGRKASTSRPWEGDRPLTDAERGWPVVGPSAIPFREGWRVPAAMTEPDIAATIAAFRAATARAREAGFTWVELHAAHGYLCHSFYSPLSNRRDDAYGGSFENRIRFTLEALRAVRSEWPERLPVAVRLSCTDWVEVGWTIEDTVSLARRLGQEGADLFDCSSGGNVPGVKIPSGAGYQVPFSEAVKRGTGMATAAVGLITDPMQADQIVRNGQADMVFLGRAELRDPYWPIHAARALGYEDRSPVPAQYGRAFTGISPPGVRQS
jgi:2,4-dienoyl-CoA reductase-like NADH-dependent reductase (Old Yellow Enzyme family)